MSVISCYNDGFALERRIHASWPGPTNLEQPPSERRPCSSGSFPARRSFELEELWGDITEGRWFVLNTSFDRGRCLTVLRRGERTPLAPRSAAVLKQALLGDAQKATAYDLGVCASTLSTLCHEALAAICTETRVARAPLLIAMAAQAVSGLRLPAARLEAGRAGEVEITLSTPWPGSCWRALLSESELHVAYLVLSGRTQRAIAATRGTSCRTVANQISSTFQKLRVSGRCALRAAAIRTLEAETQASATRVVD